MRSRFLSAPFLCTLVLLSPVAASVAAAGPRQAAAHWLSRQLHRQVGASQILLFPGAATLEGCTITRSRPVPIGATALSLRCPAHVLPQLLLVNFSINAIPADLPVFHASTLSPQRLPSMPPIVRAGAALQADWRTDSLHAELPVVALDCGAAGAEIRVRIASTNRILRARILTAHTVTIIAAGA